MVERIANSLPTQKRALPPSGSPDEEVKRLNSEADLANVEVPCMADYQVIKSCGKGSFGDVNLAREKKTGRLVAIKDLYISQILKLDKKEAVIREGKILERLNGRPYIISLYCKFKEDNQLFFVFEHCKYGTLANLIAAKEKLEPEFARRLAA